MIVHSIVGCMYSPLCFLLAVVYLTSSLNFITDMTRDKTHVKIAFVAVVFDSKVRQNFFCTNFTIGLSLKAENNCNILPHGALNQGLHSLL